MRARHGCPIKTQPHDPHGKHAGLKPSIRACASCRQHRRTCRPAPAHVAERSRPLRHVPGLFDAHQLVVFGIAVRTARCASLDLTSAQTHLKSQTAWGTQTSKLGIDTCIRLTFSSNQGAAKSAIVVSSVSPDRCEHITPHPLTCQWSC